MPTFFVLVEYRSLSIGPKTRHSHPILILVVQIAFAYLQYNIGIHYLLCLTTAQGLGLNPHSKLPVTGIPEFPAPVKLLVTI